MSPATERLVDWVEHEPISPDRFWHLVAADFYWCAVEVGRVGGYLEGADIGTLVRHTASALSIGMDPSAVLYLPQIHLASRQCADRQLTEEVYDGLAAALDAALTEHGVPSDIRRPLRDDLVRARAAIVAPVSPAGHPYLWPRPGR